MPNSLHFPSRVRWLIGISLGLLGLLILLPIFVAGVELFVVDGKFSLKNFESTLLDARQWTLLKNSLCVSVGASLLALLLGVPFAVFVTRTEFLGRKIFAALGVAPMLIPPLISAIAWVGLVGIQGPVWTALLFGFGYFPFVWILSAGAIKRIDRRVEESARLAGGWKAAIRVQASFVVPAALTGALLVFIFSMADFSVPDYLSSVGEKFNVYADEIFSRWKQDGHSGEAIAVSFVPVILIGSALCGILKLKKRTDASLPQGALFPSRIILKKGRWIVFIFCLMLVAVTVGIPIFELLREAGGIDSYLEVFRIARVDSIHSLFWSSIASIAGVLLWLFPSYFAAHSTRAGVVGWLALLPLSLPALLLGIGMIRLWNRPGPVLDWSVWVYGTPCVVILLYLMRFSAFSYFAMQNSMRTLGSAMEEAAAVSGIPWGARFRRIVLPLVMPAVSSAALLVFVFSMREIDSVTLIPAGNSTLMFRIYNYLHFGRDSLIAALCLLSIFCIALPLVLYWTWLGKSAGDGSKN